MQRKTLTVLLVLLAAGVAKSQEFWLQPKKFRLAVNEEVNVVFLAGDNFDGELWDLKKNKIVKLELSHLTKLVDLKLQVKPDAKEKMKYKLAEEGTYLLSMQSNETYLEQGDIAR